MAKKSNMPCASDSDEKWRAESDGRTLIEAQEIRNDSKRHKRALLQLKEQTTTAKGAVDLETKVTKDLKATFAEDEKGSK